MAPKFSSWEEAQAYYINQGQVDAQGNYKPFSAMTENELLTAVSKSIHEGKITDKATLSEALEQFRSPLPEHQDLGGRSRLLNSLIDRSLEGAVELYKANIDSTQDYAAKWDTLIGSQEGLSSWIKSEDILQGNSYNLFKDSSQYALASNLSEALYGTKASELVASQLFGGEDFSTLRDQFKPYYSELRRIESIEDTATRREQKNFWEKEFGEIVLPAIVAAATYYISAGRFVFYYGSQGENLSGEPGDPDKPTGWGEDYSSGQDMYYDPSTGEIGYQDPLKGGIPDKPEIPDFTIPDPVKGYSDIEAPTAVEDFGVVDQEASLSSYGEYGYAKMMSEGEVEAKLGNFGAVQPMEEIKDMPTGMSKVSNWTENMPNKTKAASYLYPS